MLSLNKEEAIKIACAEYDYNWPKHLFSGVMFYAGYRIDINEFNEWARKFK